MTMESIFDKVEKFVKETYRRAGKEKTIPHFERTVYWVRQLRSDSDEALRVAAFSHDIERAIYGDWVQGSTDVDVLQKHGELSAEIIGGCWDISMCRKQSTVWSLTIPTACMKA